MNNEIKSINIDFMYLNLDKCTRCLDTNLSLENAVSRVNDLLKGSKMEIKVNKIYIDSEDKAREYGFEISPTIRINGKDIQSDWACSRCIECDGLCSCSKNIICRAWKWTGEQYSAPPEIMIVDAILKYIYSNDSSRADFQRGFKELNTNMKAFFEEKKNEYKVSNNSCC